MLGSIEDACLLAINVEDTRIHHGPELGAPKLAQTY
jgi:hypothetical protein